MSRPSLAAIWPRPGEPHPDPSARLSAPFDQNAASAARIGNFSGRPVSKTTRESRRLKDYAGHHPLSGGPQFSLDRTSDAVIDGEAHRLRGVRCAAGEVTGNRPAAHHRRPTTPDLPLTAAQSRDLCRGADVAHPRLEGYLDDKRPATATRFGPSAPRPCGRPRGCKGPLLQITADYS